MKTNQTARTRLRLRVTLHESEPLIWRIVDVADDLTLFELHQALQVLFGWRELHAHEFTNTDSYAPLDSPSRSAPPQVPRRWAVDDVGDGIRSEPEMSTTLREAFEGDGPLFYTYDFGDGWNHKLELLERRSLAAHETPVRLMAGARRGPFEDSGGENGYAKMQSALADPGHDDHGSIASWVAITVGPWTPLSPDFFDADALQRELNEGFSPDPGGDPYDISGLVAVRPAPDGISPIAPLVDLVGEMPVAVRRELRAHLHRTGVLEHQIPDADTVKRMMRPFEWLISAVGPQGLTLTKAGWMPPAVVREGLTTLGWDREWLGAGHREEHSVPIRRLRKQAQRMGVVQVRKGRLTLGTEAKKTIGDSQAIWKTVTSRLLRGLQELPTCASALLLLSLADGSARNYSEAAGAVTFGIRALGWEIPDVTLTPQQVHALSIDVVLTLLTVEAWPEVGAERDLVTPEGRLFARAALRGYPGNDAGSR